ncbi:MAG: hypothetical protein K2N72_03845, partial [Oscillospiraceae bacterium]|nr:hypothetical protein [Oscillospiraceae bacterium]
MKLKKLLAGVTAAAMAIGLVAVTGLTASAAVDTTVTVNTSYDYLSAIVIETNGDYSINDKDVTCSSYWTQIDRKSKDENQQEIDNDYTAAFGASTEDGSTQKITFKADSSLGTIKVDFIIWDNTSSCNVGHTVNIDLSNAVNSVLNVQLIPKGDIATEISNSWWYAQEVEVKYLTQDTTVYDLEFYEPTSSQYYEEWNSYDYNFEGTWDASNISGTKPFIIIENKDPDNGVGFKLYAGDTQVFGGDNGIWLNGGTSCNIPLSNIPSCTNVRLNWFGNGNIEGITVKNETGKTVYTPASAEPEEVAATVTPTTVTVHSVSAADQAADVEGLIEVTVGDLNLTVDEDFT